jgi:hypothetical protein
MDGITSELTKSHLTRVRGLKHLYQPFFDEKKLSHLTRVRGLKPGGNIFAYLRTGVAPHAGARIETMMFPH